MAFGDPREHCMRVSEPNYVISTSSIFTARPQVPCVTALRRFHPRADLLSTLIWALSSDI